MLLGFEMPGFAFVELGEAAGVSEKDVRCLRVRPLAESGLEIEFSGLDKSEGLLKWTDLGFSYPFSPRARRSLFLLPSRHPALERPGGDHPRRHACGAHHQGGRSWLRHIHRQQSRQQHAQRNLDVVAPFPPPRRQYS